jgi:hypothetical protein
MPHLALAAFLAVTLGGPIQADAHAPVSFFVQIEPARSVFFSGDYVDVHIYANPGELANFVDLEILDGDRVVWSTHVFVAATRGVVRNGLPHQKSIAAVLVDETLPPGTYHARARKGESVSRPSAPFTIEPWGRPDEGVQVSLAAPASVASGETLVVTLSFRNASRHPLQVPADGPPDCKTDWLAVVIFEGTGKPQLRDVRKDCRTQPMMLLQPGQTRSYPVDLGRLYMYGHEPPRPFKPEAGRLLFHVSVKGGYWEAEARRPGTWKGWALSNKVSIEVR